MLAVALASGLAGVVAARDPGPPYDCAQLTRIEESGADPYWVARPHEYAAALTGCFEQVATEETVHDTPAAVRKEPKRTTAPEPQPAALSQRRVLQTACEWSWDCDQSEVCYD
eukprot:COSAG02_NODE_22550_length_748_cov_1.400616_1_plen_112_part_10